MKKLIVFLFELLLLSNATFAQEDEKKHISFSANYNIGLSNLFYDKGKYDGNVGVGTTIETPTRTAWSSTSGLSASFSLSRSIEWEVAFYYGTLNYNDYTELHCTSIGSHSMETGYPCYRTRLQLSEKVVGVGTMPKFYLLQKGIIKFYVSPGFSVAFCLRQTLDVEEFRSLNANAPYEPYSEDNNIFTDNYTMNPILSFGSGVEIFPSKKFGIGIEPIFQTRKIGDNGQHEIYHPNAGNAWYWMTSVNFKVMYVIETKKSFKNIK